MLRPKYQYGGKTKCIRWQVASCANHSEVECCPPTKWALILVGTGVILVNSGSLGSDNPIAVKYIVHRYYYVPCMYSGQI